MHFLAVAKREININVSPRHSNLESGARDYLKGLKEDFLLGHEMRLLHGLEDFHLDHWRSVDSGQACRGN
ncbi:hypothetical protein CY34DRAFT_803379 [Suillus luteus UH-Slu-Lm8-n1]|uniref:Uncharacterized protein n=1 Tax=Suillus luteus UH-Slu-Lm8-n1 TaxID=930992 RepID=A0A0D0B186_9AGAM|nr:hypothetical protein CY34DRAFT_803379 [Suillus luteus UH-Slu-Lm8-n1]